MVDMSLFKGFRLTERFGIQFRAEAFNLLNRTQFAQPNRTKGDSFFGVVTSSQAGTERKMQMSLRLQF